ncbi:MAG: outer membrane beta-barrel protein [Reichenbachiella sp.]
MNGSIKITSKKSYLNTCIFKSEDNTVKKYSPEELYGFRITDESYYVSKDIRYQGRKTKVFLEFVINGKADLYTYKDEDGLHYLVQNENDSLFALLNSKKLKVVDGENYVFHKNEYIGTLKIVFQDCPQMAPEIDQSKYVHKELVDLTEKYHKYTCSEYECINYKKNTKPNTYVGLVIGTYFSKLDWHPKSGFFHYYTPEEEFSWTTGTSVQLLLSRNNIFGFHERICANVQLGYRTNNYESNKVEISQHTLNIPAYLEYSFLNSKLTPTILLGISNTLFISSEAKFSNSDDTPLLHSESEISSIIEGTIKTYQLALLLGAGLEYSTGNISYMLKANYEIGNGINMARFQTTCYLLQIQGLEST